MNRDPSRPNPKKRKYTGGTQGKTPTGKNEPGTPHPYRRPKKDRRKGAKGATMTKQTKQQTGQKSRRTTPRQPTTRTVYEVAKRQDGKASRPALLEARGTADLMPQLVDALRLDEPTARAAALLLDQGAAITAQGWQARPVGRMEFSPLDATPAKSASSDQEAAEAQQDQQPPAANVDADATGTTDTERQ